MRHACNDGLVEPAFIGWKNIEPALALGKEGAVKELKGRNHLITDAEKEMVRWECFHEDTGNTGDRKTRFIAPPPSLEAQEPIRQPEPEVGRNDPCQCGSGKKFKKCCGR
jgi:uncharacterized protein YecA (UPF0149 family)